MAFIFTDAGEYRQLPCPGRITIGRGNENSIRPESQSVSKQHAVITTERIPNTPKLDLWIEDLNSKNGTFVGESPLDMERVHDRRKLLFGDYIRFGHSTKLFRLIDRIPDNIEGNIPEILISKSTDSLNRLGNVPVPGTTNLPGIMPNDIVQPTNIIEGNIFDHPQDDHGAMIGGTNRDARPTFSSGLQRQESGDRYATVMESHEQEDFNVMLRYNAKKGQTSQPVQLFIGGTDTSQERAKGPQSSQPSQPPQDAAVRQSVNPSDNIKMVNFWDTRDQVRDSQGASNSDVIKSTRSAGQEHGTTEQYTSYENLMPVPQLPSTQPNHPQQPLRSILRRKATDIAEVAAKYEAPKLSSAVAFFKFPAEELNKESLAKYVADLSPWLDKMNKLHVPSNQTVVNIVNSLLQPLAEKEEACVNDIDSIVSNYNSLSDPQREAIAAEFIAETFAPGSSSSDQVSSCIIGLQELLRSTVLGATAQGAPHLNRLTEVDKALLNEMAVILQTESLSVRQLSQAQIVQTLKAARGNFQELDLENVFTRCYSCLENLNLFLESLGQDSQISLAASEYFEIMLQTLTFVMLDLWQAYLILLSLAAAVNETVIRRTDIVKGQSGKSSNLLKLREFALQGDEHSMMNILRELRSQELQTVGKQHNKISRVFEIVTKFTLKSAYRQWMSATSGLRRRDLRLFEADELVKIRRKQKWYTIWLNKFREKKLMKKCLYR